MEIKKININKYKSIIEPIQIADISNFNILVGHNNAGKTNLLDAFELFFCFDEEKLKRNKMDLEIDLEINQKEYHLSIKNNSLNHPFKEEEYKNIKNRIIRTSQSIPLEEIAKNKLKRFKSDYPEEYFKFSKIIENNFEEIQMSEDLFTLNVLTKKGVKPLKRMGEGFKRLFVMLFYIFNPEYKIILIDEPELHLHPSLIKKFLKIISNLDQDKQILMTTHHPTFVQAKFLDKIWRVSRNLSQSTTVHKFGPKNFLKLDRFVQEINDENSAMLFADKVLLLEGISDYILMRNLIDKFYKKPKEIKIVHTGGFGDIELYEKICKIFNIPYLAMLDEDVLNSFGKKKFQNENLSKLEIKNLLKKENIYVLSGSLEDNYPKKYQTEKTKPLNAVLAGNKITENDFNSLKMKEIKEIIENL